VPTVDGVDQASRSSQTQPMLACDVQMFEVDTTSPFRRDGSGRGPPAVSEGIARMILIGKLTPS
jgi:hypothetical protein